MQTYTTTSSRVLRSTNIVGESVKNMAGESLGEIKDLVMDIDRGRVAYAVLSFGGFLGMGNKLFAIPWHALEPSRSDRTFVLNVPKERLEKAPGFDKDNWPDMADTRWGTTIHAYYGQSPYWE